MFLQTTNTATALSYKTNTLTVNSDGVSVGGLSFAYYHDNALTGNARVLADLGIGAEYFNVWYGSRYSNETK